MFHKYCKYKTKYFQATGRTGQIQFYPGDYASKYLKYKTKYLQYAGGIEILRQQLEAKRKEKADVQSEYDQLMKSEDYSQEVSDRITILSNQLDSLFQEIYKLEDDLWEKERKVQEDEMKKQYDEHVRIMKEEEARRTAIQNNINQNYNHFFGNNFQEPGSSFPFDFSDNDNRYIITPFFIPYDSITDQYSYNSIVSGNIGAINEYKQLGGVYESFSGFDLEWIKKLDLTERKLISFSVFDTKSTVELQQHQTGGKPLDYYREYRDFGMGPKGIEVYINTMITSIIIMQDDIRLNDYTFRIYIDNSIYRAVNQETYQELFDFVNNHTTRVELVNVHMRDFVTHDHKHLGLLGTLFRYHPLLDPTVRTCFIADADNFTTPIMIDTIVEFDESNHQDHYITCFTMPDYQRMNINNYCVQNALAGIFLFKKNTGTIINPILWNNMFIYANDIYQHRKSNPNEQCQRGTDLMQGKVPFEFESEERCITNVLIRAYLREYRLGFIFVVMNLQAQPSYVNTVNTLTDEFKNNFANLFNYPGLFEEPGGMLPFSATILDNMLYLNAKYPKNNHIFKSNQAIQTYKENNGVIDLFSMYPGYQVPMNPITFNSILTKIVNNVPLTPEDQFQIKISAIDAYIAQDIDSFQLPDNIKNMVKTLLGMKALIYPPMLIEVQHETFADYVRAVGELFDAYLRYGNNNLSFVQSKIKSIMSIQLQFLKFNPDVSTEYLLESPNDLESLLLLPIQYQTEWANLKELVLDTIREEHALQVLNILNKSSRYMPGLKVLSMSNMIFSKRNQDILLRLQQLPNNFPNLTHFRLSNVDFSGSGGKLSTMINNLSQLETLILEFINLDPRTFSTMVSRLANDHVTHLSLANNILDDSSLNDIEQLVNRLPNLQKINLAGNLFTPASENEITTYISSNKPSAQVKFQSHFYHQ